MEMHMMSKSLTITEINFPNFHVGEHLALELVELKLTVEQFFWLVNFGLNRKRSTGSPYLFPLVSVFIYFQELSLLTLLAHLRNLHGC